jgi:hypothetical protein
LLIQVLGLALMVGMAVRGALRMTGVISGSTPRYVPRHLR